MPRTINPVYSHGTSGVEGWPSVLGTHIGVGNPIEVHPSTGLNWPRIQLSAYNDSGGGVPFMTVITEINPGPLDWSTGQPDPNHWYELSTEVFTTARAVSVSMPPDAMYVRTKITTHTTGVLESMVPAIELPTGQKVSAQYPTLKKGGPV